MRRYIDVYSLPRSGSNLFASHMMLHPKINAYNVAGGRHPFRTILNDERYEILSGAGIQKNRKSVSYLLSDELKLSFVGPKSTWVEQLFFKSYAWINRKYRIRVILLRNPYAIAASMHSYQLKNPTHTHIWNMADRKVRKKFAKEYAALIDHIPAFLNSNGFIIDPYKFFMDSEFRSSFFEHANLDAITLFDIKKCREGHDYKVVNDFLECDCGKLIGFGGFNPLFEVDPNRLLTDKKFLVSKLHEVLKGDLKKQLGHQVESCFKFDGISDLEKLIQII